MTAPRYLSSTLSILLAALLIGSIGASPAAAPPLPPPVIVVAPTPPSDIPGGAPTASLQAAAAFAWQEFIALNWPAKTGMRDMPDTAQKFGAPGSLPLVWHTYRSKIEIFPGSNSALAAPHGATNVAPEYGYNVPPQYIYRVGNVSDNGLVQACGKQTPVATPAWINLDEISQIGLDSMYAGSVPPGPTPQNTHPNLVRFLAKANSTEYAYVVRNRYWFDVDNSPRRKARQNFIDAVNTQKFPPNLPYINLPVGTFEVKAAFRPLTLAEKNSNRFYSTQVRYYEQGANLKPCYREDQWGLVALHIIQKTPSAPDFVYATFEQTDNLLTVTGGKAAPVEDKNGNIVNPSATATTPALTYQDSVTSPTVSIVGTNYCNTANNPHLFYQNAGGLPGLPSAGNICVNQRDHAITSPIIEVNKAAHEAIAAYSKANGVAGSPWAYYKLVNVQAYPFNKTDIVADPASARNASTYYQSTSMLETNYTLQNFDGQVDKKRGAPTNFNAAGQPFQNNYLLNGNGALVASYNMGGCMGCHGFAQATKGSDFSFPMGAPPAITPEFPDSLNTQPLTDHQMKARFDSLFNADKTQ